MKNIINFCSYVKDKGGESMTTILEKIRNKNPIELLKEYNISMKPPIDISKLLESIGISTISQDFSEIEEIKKVEKGSILGAALSSGDDLAIFYKRFDSLHRIKFTISHELAHCCLHCPTNESTHIEYRLNLFSELSWQELKKEKEANIFAGELLIPEEVLKKYYDEMIVPSLSSLSKIFDVSTSVMAARLDYLNMPYYKDRQIDEVIFL